MANNVEYISFEDWCCELAYDDRLSGTERMVAVFGVALQNAANAVLLSVCGVGKGTLVAAKKSLISNRVIRTTPGKGRGQKTRISGCLPDGREVLLQDERGLEEYRKEAVEKRSESGQKAVRKRSDTGTEENHKASPIIDLYPKGIPCNPTIVDKKRERGANSLDNEKNYHPHFNGTGFKIREHCMVSNDKMLEWRKRFPDIDIKSKVAALGAWLDGNGGLAHWGLTEPEMWMEGKLADEQAKLKSARKRKAFYEHDGVNRG